MRKWIVFFALTINHHPHRHFHSLPSQHQYVQVIHCLTRWKFDSLGGKIDEIPNTNPMYVDQKSSCYRMYPELKRMRTYHSTTGICIRTFACMLYNCIYRHLFTCLPGTNYAAMLIQSFFRGFVARLKYVCAFCLKLETCDVDLLRTPHACK